MSGVRGLSKHTPVRIKEEICRYHELCKNPLEYLRHFVLSEIAKCSMQQPSDGSVVGELPFGWHWHAHAVLNDLSTTRLQVLWQD